MLWEHLVVSTRDQMAKKKVVKLESSPQPIKASGPSFQFPILQYGSLVGTNALLLAFSALYLPRSSHWLGIELPAQVSSKDRPQHHFLDPLTASPVMTLLWICFGAASVTVWWSGWPRIWLAEERNTRIQDATKRVQAKIYVSIAALLKKLLNIVAHLYRM